MTQQIEQAEVHAARRDSGLHKWVDNHTGSGSAEVLTDAGIVYNIPEGKQVLIAKTFSDLETVSDDCEFEVVSCDAVDGGGTPTALMMHDHIFTGTVPTGKVSRDIEYKPAILATYSSGVRSITMRVNTNDNAAIISCGWCGWVEPET